MILRVFFAVSILWLVAAIPIAPAPSSADEGSLRVGGHFKSFFTALDPTSLRGDPAQQEEPLEGAALNRLRMKVFWQPLDFVSAEFAYELSARVGEGEDSFSEGLLPHPEPPSYRGVDLRERLCPAPGDPQGSFVLAHNLDRAFVALSAPFADFYVGRQPVAFGSARVVNPTDILAPFTYEELDTEERVGVDALRAKVPVGVMGELDGGVVFGDDFVTKKGAAFLRAKLYLMETDLSLMTILFKENLLLGVDIARSMGGAGYWLEAAYTLAGATGEYASEENYLRLSSGLDYNLADGVYGFIEYHLNGAGELKPRNYLRSLAETAYREGAVYLMGRHYLAPGLTWEVTPLLIVNAQALANVADGSAFVSLTFEYSFAEDVFVEAGAFFSLGEEASGLLEIQPRSEFGLYPDIYFTSVRLYF